MSGLESRASTKRPCAFTGMVNKGSAPRIFLAVLIATLLLTSAGCSGGPLTTREKGAGLGAILGAGSGAIIGSTVGHAAAGAAIGGPVGLLVGALIGDQLMGQDHRQTEQHRQLEANQAEIERLRKENERLKQHQE